jgi:hypothetical protein
MESTKKDSLTESAKEFEFALGARSAGREREWTEEAIRAAGQLEHVFREHITGLLGDVKRLGRGPMPTLSRRGGHILVDKLRHAQSDILERLTNLQAEARKTLQFFEPTRPSPASEVVDYGAVRQQGEQALQALRQYEEMEEKLLLETANTDIGGEEGAG